MDMFVAVIQVKKPDIQLGGFSSELKNKEAVTKLQSHDPILQPSWLGCWGRDM